MLLLANGTPLAPFSRRRDCEALPAATNPDKGNQSVKAMSVVNGRLREAPIQNTRYCFPSSM